MNCSEVQSRLVELVYDELSADEAGALRAHLAACEACRGSHRELLFGRRLLDEVPADERPVSLAAQPLLTALAQRAQRSRRRWRRLAAAAVAAAVAMAIVLVAGLRVEVRAASVVIAWDERAEPVAAPPALSPPGPGVAQFEARVRRLEAAGGHADEYAERLLEHAARLAELDRLLGAAVRQVLEVDARQTADAARLSGEVANVRRAAGEELARLRERGELRWRLIEYELAQRPVPRQVASVQSPTPSEN
ncbi:MAG: zf-HC2 domain-containing protein [Planctomycetes bacterium]|nr:zf-HC2 domain-containing protein [Planctomycetota bacterium]